MRPYLLEKYCGTLSIHVIDQFNSKVTQNNKLASLVDIRDTQKNA